MMPRRRGRRAAEEAYKISLAQDQKDRDAAIVEDEERLQKEFDDKLKATINKFSALDTSLSADVTNLGDAQASLYSAANTLNSAATNVENALTANQELMNTTRGDLDTSRANHVLDLTSGRQGLNTLMAGLHSNVEKLPTVVENVAEAEKKREKLQDAVEGLTVVQMQPKEDAARKKTNATAIAEVKTLVDALSGELADRGHPFHQLLTGINDVRGAVIGGDSSLANLLKADQQTGVGPQVFQILHILRCALGMRHSLQLQDPEQAIPLIRELREIYNSVVNADTGVTAIHQLSQAAVTQRQLTEALQGLPQIQDVDGERVAVNGLTTPEQLVAAWQRTMVESFEQVNWMLTRSHFDNAIKDLASDASKKALETALGKLPTADNFEKHIAAVEATLKRPDVSEYLAAVERIITDKMPSTTDLVTSADLTNALVGENGAFSNFEKTGKTALRLLERQFRARVEKVTLSTLQRFRTRFGVHGPFSERCGRLPRKRLH